MKETQHWPFREATDWLTLTEEAQRIHSSGKSWPMAVSVVLRQRGSKEMGNLLASGLKTAYQQKIINSYVLALTAIESVEESIATGEIIPIGTVESLQEAGIELGDDQLLVAKARITMDYDNRLLKEDPSGFKLLGSWVFLTTRHEGNLNPRLRDVLKQNHIGSLEDLSKIENLCQISPKTCARLQAFDDYRYLYIMVTSESN